VVRILEKNSLCRLNLQSQQHEEALFIFEEILDFFGAAHGEA
jgi:hypothetical protein